MGARGVLSLAWKSLLRRGRSTLTTRFLSDHMIDTCHPLTGLR
jgi:hypothetical protein